MVTMRSVLLACVVLAMVGCYSIQADAKLHRGHHLHRRHRHHAVHEAQAHARRAAAGKPRVLKKLVRLKQPSSHECYTAATAMVVNYYAMRKNGVCAAKVGKLNATCPIEGPVVAQEMQLKFAYKSEGQGGKVDVACILFGVSKPFLVFTGVPDSGMKNIPSFEKVCNEIQNYRPVVAAVASPSVRHAVVLGGYNKAERSVLVYDPWGSCKWSEPYWVDWPEDPNTDERGASGKKKNVFRVQDSSWALRLVVFTDKPAGDPMPRTSTPGDDTEEDESPSGTAD